MSSDWKRVGEGWEKTVEGFSGMNITAEILVRSKPEIRFRFDGSVRSPRKYLKREDFNRYRAAMIALSDEAIQKFEEFRAAYIKELRKTEPREEKPPTTIVRAGRKKR